MKISVVIISFNTRDILERCLQTLFTNSSKYSLEVFCVDNASVDNSADMVAKKFPQVNLIRNDINRGFAPSVNQVVDLMTGDYLLILNSDARVTQGALDMAVEYLERNLDVGIAGVQLIEEDGRVSSSLREFPHLFDRFLSFLRIKKPAPRSFSDDPQGEAIDADWVTGAFLFIRSRLIKQMGLFDDKFFFYFDEADLCRRAKIKGWKVKFLPWIKIPHLDGGSGEFHGENYNKEEKLIENFYARSEKIYFRKHHGILGLAVLMSLDIIMFTMIFMRILCFSNDRKKRLTSLGRRFKLLLKSMLDTRFGSTSPPPPW